MAEDEVDDAYSSGATRHAALAAAVAASLGAIAGAEAAEPNVGETLDPALLAWNDWHEAHQLRERLWREGQPEAAAGDVGRSSDDSANRQNEDLAVREDALATALFTTPAITVLGMIAKFDALLAIMEPGPGCEDEPWPQIRGVVEDLCRLEANLATPRR